MPLNEGPCCTCCIVETFSVSSSTSSTFVSSFNPRSRDWLLTGENFGEWVGEKDGERVGDLGESGAFDKDLLFFTAEDTAWANLEGVVGEYGLGAAKLLNFSKLSPKLDCALLCLVICFSSPLGLFGVAVAPSPGSSGDCTGGSGGGGNVSLSGLPSLWLVPEHALSWLFSAAEVT